MSSDKTKKRYTINSDMVEFVKDLIPKDKKIADLFMENSWLTVVLENDLHIKIRQ